MIKNYRIYHRTWWKHNKEWPDGLEPHAGHKKHIGYADSLAEAQEICTDWNNDHLPGELSDKAEFESC